MTCQPLEPMQACKSLKPTPCQPCVSTCASTSQMRLPPPSPSPVQAWAEAKGKDLTRWDTRILAEFLRDEVAGWSKDRVGPACACLTAGRPVADILQAGCCAVRWNETCSSGDTSHPACRAPCGWSAATLLWPLSTRRRWCRWPAQTLPNSQESCWTAQSTGQSMTS